MCLLCCADILTLAVAKACTNSLTSRELASLFIVGTRLSFCVLVVFGCFSLHVHIVVWGVAYSAAVLSILKFVDIDATVYFSAPDPLRRSRGDGDGDASPSCHSTGEQFIRCSPFLSRAVHEEEGCGRDVPPNSWTGALSPQSLYDTPFVDVSLPIQARTGRKTRRSRECVIRRLALSTTLP